MSESSFGGGFCLENMRKNLNLTSPKTLYCVLRREIHRGARSQRRRRANGVRKHCRGQGHRQICHNQVSKISCVCVTQLGANHSLDRVSYFLTLQDEGPVQPGDVHGGGAGGDGRPRVVPLHRLEGDQVALRKQMHTGK